MKFFFAEKKIFPCLVISILCVTMKWYIDISIEDKTIMNSDRDMRGEELCADTDELFEVEIPNGKVKKKGCEWVADMKTKRRCDHPGVREQCPETCGSCGCTDRIGKYAITIGKLAGKKKTCNWTGEKAKQRCNDPAAQEHCPEACGLCPSSASIPVLLPVATNPNIPASFPISESVGDYEWCRDTDEKFDITSLSWITKDKTCEWATNKKSFRCALTEVIENCPMTCDKCSCMNNQNLFEVKKGERRSCSWAEKDTSWRCDNIDAVKRNCPLLCGDCEAMFPLHVPSPAPTIEKYPIISVETTLTIPVEDIMIPKNIDELALMEDTLALTFEEFLPSDSVVIDLTLQYTSSRQIGVAGLVNFVIKKSFDCFDSVSCVANIISTDYLLAVLSSILNGLDGGVNSGINQAVQTALTVTGNFTAVFGASASSIIGNVTKATKTVASIMSPSVPESAYNYQLRGTQNSTKYLSKQWSTS